MDQHHTYAFILVFAVVVVSIVGALILALHGGESKAVWAITAVASAAVIALFRYWPFG